MSPLVNIMYLRSVLSVSLILGTGASQAQEQSAAIAPAGKPNILFVAVDDLKPVLGCYGDPIARTPNFDRLAQRGTLFTNAHCSQAVCGASRASLMTGLRPDRSGITDFHMKMRTVLPGVVTIPEHFQNHGYHALGMGKIYDYRNVDTPNDQPSWSRPYFQFKDPTGDVYGYADPQRVQLIRARQEEARSKGITQWGEITRYVNHRPPTEKADVPDNAYRDGIVADEAVRSLRELATTDQPFFMAVGFYKPHLPFSAPARYWEMYDPSQFAPAAFQSMPEQAPMLHFQDSFELKNAYTGVPKRGEPMPVEQQIHLIHGYYACVSYIDAQIGKILDTLEETGKDKNTIIVLWADHGFHLGDHGMWCKHTNYEQATRVPLIIAGPSGMLPVQTTHAPVDMTDLYPTLCDLAGLPMPENFDGASLKPLLHNPLADVKPVARSQYPRADTEFGDVMGYAFRDRRYRYIQWRQADSQGNFGRGPVVARELYDYQTDPLETVNLIDHPDSRQVVERFEAMITPDNTGFNKAVFTRQPDSLVP